MRRQRLLFLALAGLAVLGCGCKDAVPADAPAEMPACQYYVALTFDDGPRNGTTDRLLDGLRERGASATFFVVGEQAAANPELVKRIKAEGHQVGNHTWSHVRLEGAAPKTVQREVEETNTLLTDLLGPGEYWLRPPYGLISPGTEKQIPVPMVKWSVDPRDWESRDTSKVVQVIEKDVKPNSIILLHDIYPTSVDAALQIVDAFQQKGYCFVTVEELLRLNGITPEAGQMYRSGDPS